MAGWDMEAEDDPDVIAWSRAYVKDCRPSPAGREAHAALVAELLYEKGWTSPIGPGQNLALILDVLDADRAVREAAAAARQTDP